MRSFVALCFIVVAATLQVSVASANVNVSCVSGDCLKSGWTTFDTYSRETSQSTCHNEDCTKSGWYNIFREQVTSEVLCKADGCFIEGWQVFDTRTGRLVSDVSCQKSFVTSDCLRFGWTTFEPGRGSFVTRCANGNCSEVGWDILIPGYAAQPVRCKTGGCFVAGWIIYR